jgi:FkbM family methyltransferase
MYHSQYKQDEFLEKNIFKGFKNGFFVDVGAHDGVAFNNTLYFEKTNGWKGVNIEPMTNVFEKLVVNRPETTNINCAISNTDGTAEFYFNTGYTDMLSGLKETYDPRHLNRLNSENNQMGSKTSLITVETKRLETLFDKYTIKHVNYLSIDVEGAELEVIKSINFDKVFIDVIEFENNYNDTSIPIIAYLETRGYKMINHKSLDIFMIHKDSAFNLNM